MNDEIEKFNGWENDGPCVITFRDHTWNGNPQYRSHSCYGCKHLEVSDYNERYCAHPAFIKAYGCHQYLGNCRQHEAKRLVDFRRCPVLRLNGVKSEPEQIGRDEDMSKGPNHYTPVYEVFPIFSSKSVLERMKEYYSPTGVQSSNC